MKISRTIFKPSDLALLGDTVEGGAHDLRLARQSSNSPSFTWTDPHGVVICCGGHISLWEGMAVTWAVVSPALTMSPYKREFIELFYLNHTSMAKIFGIRRFQADVRADFAAGKRLVEMLGYKYECDMEDYGPDGETMSQYRWLAKEHL